MPANVLRLFRTAVVHRFVYLVYKYMPAVTRYSSIPSYHILLYYIYGRYMETCCLLYVHQVYVVVHFQSESVPPVVQFFHTHHA